MKYLKLVLLVFLLACKSNPFPSTGTITSGDDNDGNERSGRDLYTGTTDITRFITIRENEEFNFKPRFVVPHPGKPLVSFTGLPAGATWDNTEGKLSWTPDYDAAYDSANPRQGFKLYKVLVNIRSTYHAVLNTTIPITFMVIDKKRAVTLSLDDNSFSIFEGSTLDNSLTISSDDYPNGPFVIKAISAFDFISVVKTNDPNRRVIKFNPKYDDILLNSSPNLVCNSSYCYIDETVVLHVALPDGRIEKVNISMRLKDRRQDPLYSASRNITITNSGEFTVHVFDDNGEEAPSIELISQPNFGTIVTNITKGASPHTAMSVNWSNVPTGQIGTTHNFTFRACVLSTSTSKGKCTQRNVPVQLGAMTFEKMTITRTDWAATDVMLTKKAYNIVKNVTATIADNSAITAIPGPVSFNGTITWRNDQLTVVSNQIGRQQFFIDFKSVYGKERREYFFVDAVEEERGTILFTVATRSGETKKLKDSLNRSTVIEALSRSITNRELFAREAAIYSTGLLKKEDEFRSLVTRTSTFDVNLFTSPNLNNLLNVNFSRLNLGTKGRFLDIEPNENLADFTVLPIAGTGLVDSTTPIKLKGTATKEAKSPLFFEDTLPSSCSPLIQLSKLGAVPPKIHTIAVKCTVNSKKVVFLGFDWADVDFTTPAQQLHKLWLNKLLEK